MSNSHRAKVVHITTVHRASDDRIFHRECRTLAEAGYDVVLVAPNPSDEFVDGVQIRALPPVNGRLGRMLISAWRAFRRAHRERASAYHLHDPELMPVALALRALGGKVIYDVHESLPLQIRDKYWLPKWVRGVVSRIAATMEWIVARSVNGVVAATPAIGRRFPAGKTIVAHNFPRVTDSAAFLPNEVPYSRRAPIVAYPGGITKDQGAREMIKAIELVRRDVKLVLAGSFETPELEEELRALPGFRRTEYLGQVSRQEVFSLLGRARIGLVVDHPTGNYIEGYSTKSFEYMAAGLPVVMSNFPLWEDIVQGAGCGINVDPADTKAIAEAIEALLDQTDEAERMGTKGRNAFLQRYNWESQSESLLGLYRRLHV